MCWQLGCGTVVSAPGAAWFGQGCNAIWLDDMNSRGREDTLSECLARSWDTHNCDHGEDTSVVCSGSVATISLEKDLDMSQPWKNSRLCYHQTSTASATTPIAGLNHPSSLDAGLRGSSVPEEEANAKQGF